MHRNNPQGVNTGNPFMGAAHIDRYLGSSFDIVYAVYKRLDSIVKIHTSIDTLLPFGEIVEDLKKGVSSAGKRKLDIETSGNGIGNHESVLYDKITVESVNGLHTLTHSFAPTSRADELLTGLKEAIREFNKNVPEVGAVEDAEIELILQRSNLNIPLWLVRVTDLGAEHTRLSRVILHVSEGSSVFAKKPVLEFTWSNSTSSILLLGASQDFIAAGVNRSEYAQNAAEVAELNAKSLEESAEISAANAENSAIASELSNTESASSADRAEAAVTQAVQDVVAGVDGQVAVAQSAAERAETASDAAFVNADVYPDISTGRAAVGDGEQFQVVAGDEVVRYRRDSASTQTEMARYPSAASVRILQDNMLETVSGKNLLDKSKIRRGYQFSPTSGAVIPATIYRCSGFIPVIPGKTYVVSGILQSSKGFFSAAQDNAFIQGSLHNGFSPFTAPAGAAFVVVNITNEGSDDTRFDDTAQVELGSVASEYEPYRRKISADDVAGLPAPPDLSLVVTKGELFETATHNLLNPADIDFTRRYSTASRRFVTDAILIAASGFIPVKEGEFYTISGTGMFGTINYWQGGLFASKDDVEAVQNITFESPVSGDGRIFQVPLGLGIKYAVLSLVKTEENEFAGQLQVEHGEMATPYQPYSEEVKFKQSLLPQDGSGGGGSSVPFNAEQWYHYTEADDGHYLSSAFPKFRSHWVMKDKDLCVVATGTSLFARSSEHCTLREDASRRPPLLHSNNSASILWDRMKWEGQEYRRYDSGFFEESGGLFLTATNTPEWDDGIYRAGFTRYSQATSAAVSFQVPAGAWQFNLIYRTDTTGVETNTVAVAEGSGLMEAFDEDSETWVEAHGFTFSMRESPVETREISVPDPGTGVFTHQTLSSRGDTTYQKRQKFRCRNNSGMDSRSAAKSLTISGSASGRFMYWGVEWSVRDHMITFINAARGSHNTRSLVKFQDNEVWSFKPDLLFFELAIHNDGAAAAGTSAPGFWAGLTNNYVFNEDYELSMKTRAAHFGLDPEIGMFMGSIAWNFGGIEEDGSLKFGPEYSTGRMMTALDKFTEACLFVWENHPEAVCINTTKRWVDAGMAIFGDLKTATLGSGKDGRTFTNEGSHWNDTGCKIIAKPLVPLFDFTHP